MSHDFLPIPPQGHTSSAARDYASRREMTLEERLADERIVFLWGEIGPGSAGGLIMRLLELQSKSPGREIFLETVCLGSSGYL